MVIRCLFSLVAEGFRKLHSEELHNLYTSPNIIRVAIKLRRMRWAGLVAGVGKVRNANKILVSKPEGRRPLRRSRCRWEDAGIDIREVGWEGMD